MQISKVVIFCAFPLHFARKTDKKAKLGWVFGIGGGRHLSESHNEDDGLTLHGKTHDIPYTESSDVMLC